MLRRARERLTYANVVATIALFGVLAGGVAVGAALKKNSVGKKQLKTGAVVTKKLADGAVTTPKLAESAVTGAKVDESTLGTVPAALQATNAVNAQGAANAQALGGNPLSAVRSATTGAQPETNIALVGTQTTVAEQTISVPAGGGTVTAFASLLVFNGTGATETEVECILESGRDTSFDSMGPSAFVNLGTLPSEGFDVEIPLVGIDEVVPAGVQTVRASCRETGVGTLANFDQGTLVVEVHPTG